MFGFAKSLAHAINWGRGHLRNRKLYRKKVNTQTGTSF